MRRILILVIGLVCLLALLRIGKGCMAMRDAARLASCRPHLLYYACEDYAKAHQGVFPALSSQFGRLMFDAKEVPAPCEPHDFVCEFDGSIPRQFWTEKHQHTPVNDWSYVYLGYFLENEEQGMAFARAYPYQAGREQAFQDDLSVGEKKGNCGAFKLFRLCTEEHLPPEATCLKGKAATVPVIIEWPGHHRKGSKVVYLDGHVEVIHYPGKFPMTKEFIEALRIIDAEIHLSQ